MTPVDNRSYYYINQQARGVPSNIIIEVELTILTLYLATLGVFVAMFALRLVTPLMLRLADYATHKAAEVCRILTILLILLIWCLCVFWVVALPLIPGVGGIIARKHAVAALS